MIVVHGSDALADALEQAYPELPVARAKGEAVRVVAGGEELELELGADPRPALERVCAFLGVAYDQALLTPFETARRTIDSVPLASVSTPSFAEVLAAAGCSVLISTYQTNKLVTARATADGGLNTHFAGVDKPMGLAVAPGRLALGTRTEVWDLRDMPAAARGAEDACYLPRRRHVTGDAAVHDLAFAAADGELWLVATAFSCLATLDGERSFVPRWTPPQITALDTTDRCHLNGLAVRDGRPAYVTALGTGDTAGSWRATRADGGVLLDVATGTTIAGGLSMPHSPRWHDGRLWVLESGRGTLATVDLASGAVLPVAELPGFTRGLDFVGPFALVGLSQIRESATFGGLPLAERLPERQCGVWMVDTRSGAIAGFLRFEDLVQELFAVAVLPHRFPNVAEPDDDRTASAFELP